MCTHVIRFKTLLSPCDDIPFLLKLAHAILWALKLKSSEYILINLGGGKSPPGLYPSFLRTPPNLRLHQHQNNYHSHKRWFMEESRKEKETWLDRGALVNQHVERAHCSALI